MRVHRSDVPERNRVLLPAKVGAEEARRRLGWFEGSYEESKFRNAKEERRRGDAGGEAG
jgi:hypothetical protein